MTEPRSDLWSTGATGTAHRGGAAHAVPAGATGRRPSTPRSGRPWLPLVLLALLAVAALLFGLVRCGADRAGLDPAAVPAVPTAVIPGAGAAAAPSAPVPGSLTAGTTSLFAAARSGDRGLAALAGQTATGHAVPVQSVPADEGFWIGTGPTDRVWVQFTASGESAITITPGQLLDLSGPIVPHGADFARKAGVAAADGAEQLTGQGAHLEVDPNQVKVVGTR
jgi:hypothetical protein